MLVYACVCSTRVCSCMLVYARVCSCMLVYALNALVWLPPLRALVWLPPLLSSLLSSALVCSCLLSSAFVCSSARQLLYALVCSHMLLYSLVCYCMLPYALRAGRRWHIVYVCNRYAIKRLGLNASKSRLYVLVCKLCICMQHTS